MRVMITFRLPSVLPVALLASSLLSDPIMPPRLDPGLAHAAPPASEPAPPRKWTLDLSKGTGSVSFDAIGRPSALKIHGKGEAPKGELSVEDGKLSGTCTFRLDTLDTGIGLRNKHMKERYLEVGKFPLAKLAFTSLPLPENAGSAGFSHDALPFKGVLSLHGVDKPVEGTAKVSRQGDAMALDARFGIKTTDFGIATPSFAGVTMAEDVTVEARITAPLQGK